MIPRFGELQGDLLRHGSDDQLTWISPLDRFSRQESDVYIRVMAEQNTKSLSDIQVERQMLRRKSVHPLLQAMMERAAAGEMRWVLTLFPTDGYAQDAEMATADFTEFVFNAGKLTTPDPVAAWQEQSVMQQRLIDWLADKSEVHIQGPDTDLYVGIKGRTWINCDGDKNFPDGEIFTGPIENATRGHVRFTFPRVTDGREIDDIWLKFEDGRVVDATAARGMDFLYESLDADEGARVLGEFAFGTNSDITRFTRNILFDEKIGGTVHMALGAGYPESGSINQSAIHWDLICDLRLAGSVEVDGIPFMRDGEFLV
jgi:aminopeptidase